MKIGWLWSEFIVCDWVSAGLDLALGVGNFCVYLLCLLRFNKRGCRKMEIIWGMFHFQIYIFFLGKKERRNWETFSDVLGETGPFWGKGFLGKTLLNKSSTVFLFFGYGTKHVFNFFASRLVLAQWQWHLILVWTRASWFWSAWVLLIFFNSYKMACKKDTC